MTPHDPSDPAALQKGLHPPFHGLGVFVFLPDKTHLVDNAALEATKSLTQVVTTEVVAVVARIKGSERLA